MSLINRWKAPTPKKWKRIMYFSMMMSVVAVIMLNGERTGGALIPGFTFKLYTWAEIMWKYIFFAGAGSAAISKFQKENPPPSDDDEEEKKS